MNGNEQKLVNFKYEIRKNDGSSRQENITLPMSEKRYAELAAGLKPDGEAWQKTRDALANLAFLQGGELGAWSIELELKGDFENDKT